MKQSKLIKRDLKTDQAQEFSFPDVTESSFAHSEKTVYFGGIGFEKRSLAFLKQLDSKPKLRRIYGIEYEPYNEKNRKEEFLSLARQVGEDLRLLTYDRFHPVKFLESIKRIGSELEGCEVVVDISGLSKMTVMILLQVMSGLRSSLRIFYAEADVYHPTREKYESEKNGEKKFRTTNVYAVVTVPSLTSTSMQGAPFVLAAFPTFNKLELTAMMNETNPQRLFLIEGRSPYPENEWRVEAIREVNEENEEGSVWKKTVSTRYYNETFDALEEIYHKVRYTHRLLVAPTGSKMSALSVFFFKQVHPEIQVLYPVTADFDTAYTDGFRKCWEVQFPDFSEFIEVLRKSRMTNLRDFLKISD